LSVLDAVLKSYQSPTRVVHAVGALTALGEEAANLNVKRPLVVTDQGIVKAGLLEEALKPLRAAGVDPVTYDQVRANPGIALVDAGARYYQSERCDGLVAIGGGSSIDAAKGIEKLDLLVVADGELHLNASATAEQRCLDRAAYIVARKCGLKRVNVAHLVAIEGQQDVSELEVGLGCR